MFGYAPGELSGKPIEWLADGILLPLRLSQQDLANLIGVTRESVNLALADFRERGLVETDGRALRVRRPDELRALV